MSNLSDPALPADALPAASLSDRQTDLTRQLIVDAALDLLERVYTLSLHDALPI